MALTRSPVDAISFRGASRNPGAPSWRESLAFLPCWSVGRNSSHPEY
jgi:hypothetical protein